MAGDLVIRVLFQCPVTDHLVPTGVSVDDVDGYRPKIPRSGTVETCTACSRKHTWWREETVLEGRQPRKVRPEIA